MKYNKLMKIILLAVAFSANSIPALAEENDIHNDTNVQITDEQVDNSVQSIDSQSDGIDNSIKERAINNKIENNWLTREIAKQLNKEVSALSKEDFLNIKRIELKNTCINNEIPNEINLLENLEYLNLYNANLKGQVPESLGNLSKLSYLDLGNNHIYKLPQNLIQKIKKGSYFYCNVEENEFKLGEGWHFLKGQWCFFTENGERTVGIKTINNKVYYFNSNGEIKVGWEKDKNNNWYYSNGLNGIIQKDWKLVNNKWYYFDEKGIMQTGLQSINGRKYYLSGNGDMLTDWVQVDNNWCFFGKSGDMQYGWIKWKDIWYYLDKSSGIMFTGNSVIDGAKYKFATDGSLMTNIWIDEYNYVQTNGYSVNTYNNYSHSNTNYNLFKYTTNINNDWSVYNKAVALHGGDTRNNCVFFASEALRRININIPTYTANTYDFEKKLLNQGFKRSYDLSQLKAGDIIITNGYTHTYIFMYWDTDGYAYVVDNQGPDYNNQMIHRRSIIKDDANVDRASHFFYAPY